MEANELLRAKLNGEVPPDTVTVSEAVAPKFTLTVEELAESDGAPFTTTLITIEAVAETESVTVIVS